MFVNLIYLVLFFEEGVDRYGGGGGDEVGWIMDELVSRRRRLSQVE